MYLYVFIFFYCIFRFCGEESGSENRLLRIIEYFGNILLIKFYVDDLNEFLGF